jgi:glycerol-3-phosphate dehydrogenase
MTREAIIAQLQDASKPWDILIIGGGATGLGAGVEAASRGYRVLLVEQGDFSQGTSSRSTKLVHGGVRYLQQGNIALVMGALHERGVMLRNAPHLVHNQAFVVPDYKWWERPFYGIGLKLYDVLAGKLGFGHSRILSREETLEKIPGLESQGLRGGVIYYDGQFDDARFSITLARTMEDQGGFPLNYCQVTSLLKDSQELVAGAVVEDKIGGQSHEVCARVVINATGAFVDSIRQMDKERIKPLIAPSQGVHIVLDRSFNPGHTAIMVPHTDDGRVIFLVPWHDRVLVGTTDTPIAETPLEPTPLEAEIEFLLQHAARYLARDPKKSDILSAFAGIRPLIASQDTEKTSSLSREHHLTISQSGLVTIAGGKWTTYRKMGQDTIDQAARLAGLAERPSKTEALALHGWTDAIDPEDPFSIYGSDAEQLLEWIRQSPELGQTLHPHLPYRKVEVLWAVRREWAQTIADVLRHRTRALILDARASMAAAPLVARLMAAELGKDEAWQANQVQGYLKLAANYIVE